MTIAAYNSTGIPNAGVGQVSLPPSLFSTLGSKDAGVVFSVYEEAAFFPVSEDLQGTHSIESAVFSATVAGENITGLTEPLTIVLQLRNQVLLTQCHNCGLN